MLTDEEHALVEAAAATLRRAHRSEDHTVASAAYDSGGHAFTGMNVAHFTGGPCAELVVIGQAVASDHADLPLTAIVAVSDRGVISPCGRCRQILFDQYPGIQVIVRGKNGLISVPVTDLLPYAFDWRALEPDSPQTLHFWEGYLDDVHRGTKTTTIRVHDPVQPGPCRIVFDHDGRGTATTLYAEITDVVAGTVDELTHADAAQDGFADLDQLRHALNRHYPGIHGDTRVDVVQFRLTEHPCRTS